jgi:hypothetical protein
MHGMHGALEWLLLMCCEPSADSKCNNARVWLSLTRLIDFIGAAACAVGTLDTYGMLLLPPALAAQQ